MMESNATSNLTTEDLWNLLPNTSKTTPLSGQSVCVVHPSVMDAFFGEKGLPPAFKAVAWSNGMLEIFKR